MIGIKIDYLEEDAVWRYQITSEDVDLSKHYDLNMEDYAFTAEDAFKYAWEIREIIRLRFWMENQLEIQF